MDIYNDFNSRALQPHSPINEDIAYKLQNSPIAVDYKNIDPKRSILLYDCSGFNCSQDYLSLQSIFTVAARAANPTHPDAEGLAQSWYNFAKTMDVTIGYAFPYTNLGELRFQLLAVANRMDMATWTGDYWSGAEIHFAYGLTPAADLQNPENLTLILEFELAPNATMGFSREGFQKLAKVWRGLSDVPTIAYPDALKAALRASGLPFNPADPSWIKAVRLRMNHEVHSGRWRLTQLLLNPAAGAAFAPANLNNQLGSVPPTDLWTKAQIAMVGSPTEYSIPETLWIGPTTPYRSEPVGMSPPPGICAATEKARNVLGIQQCTFCHTTESATQFTHIANRVPSKSATLSGFLLGQGNGENIHPSLVDLYSRNEHVVWKVDVPYDAYTGSGCTTPVMPRPTAAIYFHDVARRTLFLAAELNDALTNLHATPSAQKLSTHSIE